VVEKFTAIFVISLWKSQSGSHSLCFVLARECFRYPSFSKLVIASPHCDNFLEKVAWNVWKFTRIFWHCEASSFKNGLVNILKTFITHCRWLTTLLFIINICSLAHLWTFYTTTLQFLHSLHFGHKPFIIRNGLPHPSGFGVKTADNTANFAAGGFINRKTHHSSFWQTKALTGWPVRNVGFLEFVHRPVF
jgi:hypothetical protein